MKIVNVVGARPQFIKVAVVLNALERVKCDYSQRIEKFLVHTGQHYDENMYDAIFRDLNIPLPDINLGIGNCSHGAMIGRMVEELEKTFSKIRPQWVIVYGDTNSTVAAAIVARRLGIKLAHVEAGVRSFNIGMPEEQNRIVTDRLSDVLFCPTETAVDNLRREGIVDSPYSQKVINAGDVMYDAFYQYFKESENGIKLFEKYGIERDRYIVCTIHREENTDNKSRFVEIMSALKELSCREDILFPVHPRTKKVLLEAKLSLGNIKIIEPVSYSEMLHLEKYCKMIITDSGGMQKEAYFFRKPCITVRNETEWTELVKIGVNVLAGAQRETIVAAVDKFNNAAFDYDESLYGDGTAGRVIVEGILGEHYLLQETV